MQKYFRFLLMAVVIVSVSPIQGQGTFQNLDFESAILPVVPSGQFGTFEPIGGALPFWTAYLGTNQVTQILHNNFFTGTANVSILGPDWTFTHLIDGDYTVLLQPGSTGHAAVDVSIGQTGLIPRGTESIRFKSDRFLHHFGLSVGGDSIPVFLLESDPNYNSYGADISPFVGLMREVRITAFLEDLDNRFDYLDSVVFSNQPIPEPSVFGLFALGALLFGWHSLKRESRIS